MKHLRISVIALSILAFISCKNQEKKEMEENQEEMTESMTKEEMPMKKEVDFELASKSGSTAMGKVSFVEENGQVTFTARLYGLKPGIHAIHIHEKADCTAEDGTSSGGHWNPTFQPHGKWGDAGGYHLGDIGNFEANENGEGSITLTTDQWCIGCGDANKDVLGKAIIVHEGADDFTSQPSGNAGARVSCGGIIE
ncbi:MAG TPA: superoxide dismutase family protein [Flavobacteriaceae bacterium]|nr:superoxide dismutase family protein [Flavobacteriaceae bacterium]MCB9213750.1 superoxide dismutase family protein [Alteromonas sp.]HPF11333.1 superoxide dismutase family protein [Flavobacteriaceae bacterium]HQU22152.1 superoxide dismutase family protein [Flavobacteriaceae bacterium]HQU64448.1 superoxide dismutase family protein [Flavobacteriaceae bacterium]